MYRYISTKYIFSVKRKKTSPEIEKETRCDSNKLRGSHVYKEV